MLLPTPPPRGGGHLGGTVPGSSPSLSSAYTDSAVAGVALLPLLLALLLLLRAPAGSGSSTLRKGQAVTSSYTHLSAMRSLGSLPSATSISAVAISSLETPLSS